MDRFTLITTMLACVGFMPCLLGIRLFNRHMLGGNVGKALASLALFVFIGVLLIAGIGSLSALALSGGAMQG